MSMQEQAIASARNPFTSSTMLDALANHQSVEVLEYVAENPNTSQRTLARLATHRSPKVCMAVAENENTQFSDLAALAFHENPDVRYRMAENPRMPVKILMELTEDQIRMCVFAHSEHWRW